MDFNHEYDMKDIDFDISKFNSVQDDHSIFGHRNSKK
jgi:hypothetical protein